MRYIASILSGRARNEAALIAVGLALPTPSPKGFKAACGLPCITWDHYPPGTSVQILAITGPWKHIAKQGDTGVVLQIIQAEAPGGNPPSDLYAVKLDLPLRVGKEVAYLTYKELKSI